VSIENEERTGSLIQFNCQALKIPTRYNPRCSLTLEVKEERKGIHLRKWGVPH